MKINHIPSAIKNRARERLQLLEQGASLSDVQGKRLKHFPHLISIRLGRWRLLVDERGCKRSQILHHARYDNYLSQLHLNQ